MLACLKSLIVYLIFLSIIFMYIIFPNIICIDSHYVIVKGFSWGLNINS